jgi:endonuclease G
MRTISLALETEVRRLAQSQAQLAELLAHYMSEPALESDERTGNSRAMAEAVIRIVGGVETRVGEFDDCCIVGRKNSNGTLSWFSSGVLVHPSVVITAAQCIQGVPNVVALSARRIADLSAAEIVSTRPIVRHPQLPNDIAVLVLCDPASETAPTRIAAPEEIASARRSTLVGFGNDDRPGTRGFGVKRKVIVDITGVGCTEFVAGGDGFDSCYGDSGGPAYITVGGDLRVAGVTSRAVDTSAPGCGGGIYSRADVHREFVREVAHGFGITL